MSTTIVKLVPDVEQIKTMVIRQHNKASNIPIQQIPVEVNWKKKRTVLSDILFQITINNKTNWLVLDNIASGKRLVTF